MFYPLLQHENKGSYTRIKAIERISIGSIAAIISFTKEKYSIVPVADCCEWILVIFRLCNSEQRSAINSTEYGQLMVNWIFGSKLTDHDAHSKVKRQHILPMKS